MSLRSKLRSVEAGSGQWTLKAFPYLEVSGSRASRAPGQLCGLLTSAPVPSLLPLALAVKVPVSMLQLSPSFLPPRTHRNPQYSAMGRRCHQAKR